MLEYETLKFIWLLLIGALWIGFAVSGGYDLGVNILLVLIGKTDQERRLILASIGATWEGNQVWLITAAGAMFAAWPLMYATAFSSFYLALLLVLIALILRPPGLDYRSKLPSLRWRNTWDYCLFLSGLLPLFLLGVAFGNLFIGLDFYFDESLRSYFTGGFFSLLHPFCLLTGIVSLTILTLQACFFLQLKTPSPIDTRARTWARVFGFLFIITFCVAWFWAVFYLDGYQITDMPNPNQSFAPIVKTVNKGMGLWGHNYQVYPLGYLAPILSIISVLLALFFSSLGSATLAIFINSIAIATAIITAGFTLFPFVLPSSKVPAHSLSIWDAASSQLTLMWMFVAAIIFLPIILAYTIWVFRVVRGKVSEADISY